MKKINRTGFWESNEDIYHVRCEGLSNWIASYLSEEKHFPLYDFGCGLGHYLQYFYECGFTNLTGFEGKIPINKQFNNIIEQDLTAPFTVPTKGNVVCLEVGEHIPIKFENILLDNISNACNNNLIMSWAVRGQDGEGHVNCQNNNEIIPKIVSRGFIYLQDETLAARATVNDYAWFQNTTLIFKRV